MVGIWLAQFRNFRQSYKKMLNNQAFLCFFVRGWGIFPETLGKNERSFRKTPLRRAAKSTIFAAETRDHKRIYLTIGLKYRR